MRSKILFLIVICFCVAYSSTAQFQRGEWVSGGNAGFNYDRSGSNLINYSATTTTSIDPYIALAPRSPLPNWIGIWTVVVDCRLK